MGHLALSTKAQMNTARKETELIESYFALTPRKREERWKTLTRFEKVIIQQSESESKE